ncbi:AAA family ATPase [Streptomyces sp. NPDC051940]|uniref:helix-turn-helix transcriptional regulator n=1 Tax=Streptomyces sp. NPDC051940 TaxID=3155675 RepID=UPI00343DDBA5
MSQPLPARPGGRDEQPALTGRERETAEVERLLHHAAGGSGGALVVRGEAGIGKTALLDHAARRAEGMRVVRGVGVEAEAELAFAGLHQLLGTYADRLDALPAPQAAVLRGAFGLTEALGADRFLVGVATLSLLDELAEDRPLLVLVDDAQWLDRTSADALLFAARRLDAERLVLVFAARDGHPFPASGLPELWLGGIDRAAAAEVLGRHAADLAEQVRERILDEAEGNPLALLELPGALSPAQRAGELPLEATPFGSAQPLPGRIQERFTARIQALPPRTRLLLLLAAADDTGDLDLLLRSAHLLDGSLDDLEPAEAAGLVRIAERRMEFRHPLVRTAAYHEATMAKRVAVHRALAEALRGGDEHGARRAWHLAAAATGPDDEVAAELEATAERALTVGGYAAVAAALQRSAQLTADPARRTGRLAAAADAAVSAGLSPLAEELAGQALPRATDPLVVARLARVQAAIAGERDLPARARRLLTAAAGIVRQSPDEAAFMCLDAMTVAWAEGGQQAARELAAQAAAIPAATPLLGALASAVRHLADEDLQTGLPLVRRLLREVCDDGQRRGLWERGLVQWWFHWTADVDTAHDEAVALAQDCRDQGAIGMLPRVLMYLARSQLYLGRCRDVQTTAAEGLRIAQDTAQTHYAGHLTGLLACAAATQGDEERCRSLADDILGEGPSERGVECLYALSLLDLGLGRYDEALRRLEPVIGGHGCHLAMDHTYGLAPYVEAAARGGDPRRARAACEQFTGWARATGRPWPRAVALRLQALLAPGDEPDRLYARAVALHRQDVLPFEGARTELLYGEWLRRAHRRGEARAQLRQALETFETLRARPWAERARRELRATGESVPAARTRGGPARLLDILTPQELQIVRMAATGMSNRDIAAVLFLSPRTVGYHLYKAFPKLGIASRRELALMNPVA